jgi:hypothetical protein
MRWNGRGPEGTLSLQCRGNNVGDSSLRDDDLTERATVTKIIFSRSGHGPKTVLFWKQEFTRQSGLPDGPAWPCIDALHPCKCCQPPATHQRLSARELGVANRNVTSEVTDQARPQLFWRLARVPEESRVRSVRPLD